MGGLKRGEGKTFHVGYHIEGSLKKSDDFLDGMLSSNGKTMNGKEVREFLEERKKEGLVYFSGCSNTDEKGSCLGHKKMKIEETTIKKIRISDIEGLDPISVVVEDLEPRKGKIIIECYGKSWSAYWGGMGKRNLMKFFVSCSACYIIGNFSGVPEASIPDMDKLKEDLRGCILKDRRSYVIDKDEAREYWDELSVSYDNPGMYQEMMEKFMGYDFWNHIPEKSNPDYQYIVRVVEAVQLAFKEMI